MFIRFVAPCRDECSHCLTGVFQATWQMCERGLFDHREQREYDDIRGWFNHRLPVPTRLSRSRRPHACAKAVCWFKPCATEHIARVRQLAGLLERHGIPTRMLRTERPGYVVYQDRYQLAAVPFRDTLA